MFNYTIFFCISSFYVHSKEIDLKPLNNNLHRRLSGYPKAKDSVLQVKKRREGGVGVSEG